MYYLSMYSEWGGSVGLASNATRIGDLSSFSLLATERSDCSSGVIHQKHENEGVVVLNECLTFFMTF